MATVRVKITGLSHGKVKSVFKEIGVPDYEIKPPYIWKGIQFPATSIKSQQCAYIDERYTELIFKYAESNDLYPVFNYSIVEAQKTRSEKDSEKIKEIKALLSLSKNYDETVNEYFMATMAAMWPAIKKLPAIKIIEIVYAALNVGLKSATKVADDFAAIFNKDIKKIENNNS